MKWQLHEWLRELELFAYLTTVKLVRKDGTYIEMSPATFGCTVGKLEVDVFNREGVYLTTYPLSYIFATIDNCTAIEDLDYLDVFSTDWELDEGRWIAIQGYMQDLKKSFKNIEDEIRRADREEN